MGILKIAADFIDSAIKNERGGGGGDDGHIGDVCISKNDKTTAW